MVMVAREVRRVGLRPRRPLRPRLLRRPPTPDSGPDSYADPDSGSDADPYTDADSHADTNSDADSYTYADSDAHSCSDRRRALVFELRCGTGEWCDVRRRDAESNRWFDRRGRRHLLNVERHGGRGHGLHGRSAARSAGRAATPGRSRSPFPSRTALHSAASALSPLPSLRRRARRYSARLPPRRYRSWERRSRRMQLEAQLPRAC